MSGSPEPFPRIRSLEKLRSGALANGTDDRVLLRVPVQS